MREDGYFLMDEISLADDSVLERLNRYVLENCPVSPPTPANNFKSNQTILTSLNFFSL